MCTLPTWNKNTLVSTTISTRVWVYNVFYTNLGKDKADKKMYSKIFNFALDYLMTNVRKS